MIIPIIGMSSNIAENAKPLFESSVMWQIQDKTYQMPEKKKVQFTIFFQVLSWHILRIEPAQIQEDDFLKLQF